MSAFSLDRNAFAVLDVGLRSNHQQILEAHDERLFGGGDETGLSAARSRLTVVRDRIDEEISFLPELAPNKAREILRAVSSIRSSTPALPLVEQVTNLSRLNLLADFLGRVDDPDKLIHRLIEAHAAFDPAAARECLEQARASSGVGRISDSAWQQALAKLRDRHAGVLTNAIVGHTEGPILLTKALEKLRGATISSWHRNFIDDVVDRYDRWSQAKLGVIEDELDQAIAALRESPESSSLVSPIKTKLREWDELSQPVQLRDEAKGMDEPRSKKVFGKVRDLAISLCNDHNQLETALDLSRALQATFPELPSVADLITKDIDALDSLIEQSRASTILGPLVSAVEKAEASLSNLGREIQNNHFHSHGKGLAGELYREFEVARANTAKFADPTLPWKLVRSVAIDLNNEADLPEAARIVIAHILGSAPTSIAPRLREDLTTLEQHSRQAALTRALEKNDLNEAHDLVTQLLGNASPGERPSLEKVRAAIAQKQTKRTFSRLGWGAFALFMAVSLILESTKTSPTDYGSTDYSSSDQDAYADPTAELATETPSPPEEATTADQSVEEAPPVGGFGALSIPQLRYCLFEEERLTVMEAQLPRAAYDAFNSRVDDFNSRCRGTSYSLDDHRRVGLELAQQRSNLAAEAQTIVSGWIAPEWEMNSESQSGTSLPDLLDTTPENVLAPDQVAEESGQTADPFAEPSQ